VISSKGHHYSSRVKQWLSQMRQSYAEAHELFMLIKRIKKCDDMQIALERYLDALMTGKVDEWKRSIESQ
jgi:hypothetical protein